MEYKVRLHIKVSSIDIWKRFEGFDNDVYDFSKLKTTSFVAKKIIRVYSSLDFTILLTNISKLLGNDGIMIADIMSYSDKAINIFVHHLGDEGVTINEIEDVDFAEDIAIDDIPHWLNMNKITLEDYDKEVLLNYQTNERPTYIYYIDYKKFPLSYRSRLHIKVSSVNVWNRFKDIKINNNILSETLSTSFIDNSLPISVEELYDLVQQISILLGNDGIIFADATACRDAFDVIYSYRIYNFHNEVVIQENKQFDLLFKCRIEDITKWLNYTKTMLNEVEKEHLLDYDVIEYERQYISFNTNFELPDKIYLRETSFYNQRLLIENTVLGEQVNLAHVKDKYDPFRIEVMTKKGLLGILPSHISDNLTPLLISNRLNYSANIVEIIPSSKRNKHAKSSIVAININIIK